MFQKHMGDTTAASRGSEGFRRQQNLLGDPQLMRNHQSILNDGPVQLRLKKLSTSNVMCDGPAKNQCICHLLLSHDGSIYFLNLIINEKKKDCNRQFPNPSKIVMAQEIRLLKGESQFPRGLNNDLKSIFDT
jgi:hypothetical protein